jgi:hypothetical protein
MGIIKKVFAIADGDDEGRRMFDAAISAGMLSGCDYECGSPIISIEGGGKVYCDSARYKRAYVNELTEISANDFFSMCRGEEVSIRVNSTVEDWLKCLPDGYKDMAMKIMVNRADKCSSLTDAIYLGIPSIDDFWQQVYDHYDYGRPLPH